MGLSDWLGGWFKRTKVTRNVSSLIGSDPEAATETINLTSKPLKDNHRRLAHRDPRLLPKPKSQFDPRSWIPQKRQKYLTTAEATRLFSATQRTKNRNLRDLTIDREQLSRHGLPAWNSEEDIAGSLGITLRQLHHYSMHRYREAVPHYVTFAIQKRSGGVRLIHAPKRRLKAIQRQLTDQLVNRLPVSTYAHGFRTGRSVSSNAQPHIGHDVVIKFDIKDCFPSIHYGRVRGLLISLGYSYPVATTLAVLMTESPRQPVSAEGKTYYVPVGPRVCVQGAPTSPGICNAILLKLDHRLAGTARACGFQYSRYADDLTFSGNDGDAVGKLIARVSRIVREEGFRLNREKTRILRQSRCQRVTGVVVNQGAGLSRAERRRLRAAIHQLKRDDQEEIRRISGKLAYLKMLNPEQASPLRKAFESALKG